MSENNSGYLSHAERERLKEVLKLFELETNYMDAIVFINDGGEYKIIFDYSVVSNSSEDLAYWFYHLDLRNVISIEIGEIRGFTDVFKDKYDVVMKVNQNVFVFVSKDCQNDNTITTTEELRLKILSSDLEEAILSSYV